MNPSFWDERYGHTAEYVFGTAPNAFLEQCAERIPAGGPVLCLAEGEGRNAVYLAGRGHPVTAVDQSSVGLEKAVRLASARSVMIGTELADLGDYIIEPGVWAAVVVIFAHLTPELRARVHAAAVEGLRPGGVLILEAYHPEQLRLRTGGPMGAPEMLMTLEMLRGDLAGLDLEIAQEIERDVLEGCAHTGRAAVVQVCGRKPHAVVGSS
jgi:hypothetical protein